MDQSRYDAGVQEILQNIGNPNADHSNIQPYIRRLNISFIVLSCFIIGLRTLVRAMLVKHVAIEDYLMLAAGVSATAFFALNIMGKPESRYFEACDR
jgi:hypothetical protein